MKLRIPDYYKEFHCIAEDCKDSCCIGWEIDIDEETYDYYQQLTGEIGDRLRENMVEGSERHFRLKKGRCPFLNQKNLCDLCVELGEESLCEVCTENPRFTMEYGQVREKCLALSCEEVGRLVFESEKKFTYEEVILSEDYEEDDEYIKIVEFARDQAFSILHMRTIPINQRIACYLEFIQEVQNALNQNEYTQIQKIAKAFELTECRKLGERLLNSQACSQWEIGTQLEERIALFEEMQCLDEEWRSAFAQMKEVLCSKIRDGDWYKECINRFMDYYVSQEREYEYEHLMDYFTFRYFMRAVYDYNLLSKAKLAVVSFLCIRDLDLVRFIQQKEKFTLKDRIDVARIYSKEVEHSEDNMEYLGEAFDFEDVFTTEQLMTQIFCKCS